MLKVKIVSVGEGEERFQAMRLPQRLLKRYGIEGVAAVDLAPDGFTVRPIRAGKSSWRATAAATARCGETWAGWEECLPDGLETL